MLKITLETQAVVRNLDALSRTSLSRAIVRTLNKTAANVRTGANVAIRKKRALPARTVRDAMSIKKATTTRLVSSLSVTGRPIPLRDYKARPTRRGVTVSVTPGARKLVAHRGNAGFIVGRIGGHVFAREGRERLPIKKLFGPSLPSTFVQDEVKAAWLAVAKESMIKRGREELAFELQRLAR